MLLPFLIVADVIARWQMLSPLGGFILILVLSCSTEPHPIYEADWYLPIFLFRDGLFTLI